MGWFQVSMWIGLLLLQKCTPLSMYYIKLGLSEKLILREGVLGIAAVSLIQISPTVGRPFRVLLNELFVPSQMN